MLRSTTICYSLFVYLRQLFDYLTTSVEKYEQGMTCCGASHFKHSAHTAAPDKVRTANVELFGRKVLQLTEYPLSLVFTSEVVRKSVSLCRVPALVWRGPDQ